MSKTKVSDTYEGLMSRASEFLDQLIDKLNEESPEIHTIIIFTHAATKIALGRALLKDPNAQIRTGTCSLDTFVLENGSWSAKALGETHYLSEGEEMHWDFGEYRRNGPTFVTNSSR